MHESSFPSHSGETCRESTLTSGSQSILAVLCIKYLIENFSVFHRVFHWTSCGLFNCYIDHFPECSTGYPTVCTIGEAIVTLNITLTISLFSWKWPISFSRVFCLRWGFWDWELPHGFGRLSWLCYFIAADPFHTHSLRKSSMASPCDDSLCSSKQGHKKHNLISQLQHFAFQCPKEGVGMV